MNDTFTPGNIVLTPDVIFHLDRALRRAGYEPRDMQKLRHPKSLEEVLAYLRGNATFTKNPLVFNLDAYPQILDDDWRVEEHQQQGRFIWDASKVLLRRHPEQMTSNACQGHFLSRCWWASSYNATFLDYFKFNQEGNIPGHWMGKKIVCWGTLFWWQESKTPSNRYVRYLDCTDSNFPVLEKSLDEDFDETFYSAIKLV